MLTAPLSDAPEFGPGSAPAPAAPPSFVPPSPAVDDRNPEYEAALQRERAYASRHERQWRGVALQPWSRERDSILSRLIEADFPGESLEELLSYRDRYNTAAGEAEKVGETFPRLSEMIDFGLYLPDAAKLLWIASHEAKDIAPWRARMAGLIAHVEAWSADNIADEEIEEACILAAEIRTGWKAFRPLIRPTRSGRNADAGN